MSKKEYSDVRIVHDPIDDGIWKSAESGTPRFEAMRGEPCGVLNDPVEEVAVFFEKSFTNKTLSGFPIVVIENFGEVLLNKSIKAQLSHNLLS